MACYLHKFKQCSAEEPSCATCCVQEVECGNYYIEDLVGSTGNIQIGDKFWLTSECSGETAPAGIYTDCDCKVTCGNEYTYGCVTVDASGLVTAIAACDCGEGAPCGDGPQSNCPQAGSLTTNIKQLWNGRQKVSVTTLDTWETLFDYPLKVILDPNTSEYVEIENENGYYLKQIYIHNCDKGSTNDKKFSIRIYSADGGYMTLSEGVPTFTAVPAEVILADRLKLADNERVALLGTEVPLHLTTSDLIQIQAHTSTDGWVISAWLEEITQNWDQSAKSESYTIKSDNAGMNSINMSGLSSRLRGGRGDKRFKPGAASTSGEG